MTTTTAAVAATVLAGFVPAAQAAQPDVGTVQLVDVTNRPGVASTSSEYREAADVSDDGRFVVFASSAQDLFRPFEAFEEANEQLYLRDTVLNTTTQINVNAGDPYSRRALQPKISDDGMLVAYLSRTWNPASARYDDQAYVWSAITRLSTLVSVSYETPSQPVNSDVTAVDISGSGNALVFATEATDVLPGDPYVVPRSRVYRLDAASGDIVIVERDPALSAKEPAISADGQSVGFISSDAHTAVATGGVDQAYVVNVGFGSTELVSVDPSGTRAGNGPSSGVSISRAGDKAAFASEATNLTGTSTTVDSRVYLRDRTASATTIASRDASGTVIAGTTPSLSNTGRVLLFSGVVGGTRQVLMRDLLTGSGRIVSMNRVVSGAQPSVAPTVSGNGVFVVWSTQSTNLTADSYPYSPLHAANHYMLANLGAR